MTKMMFNLKRKVKQIGQSVKRLGPIIDTQLVIAEIHESFDSASEKLLNDAKAILAGSYDIEKGERLKKIGFVLAKKAVEASAIISENKRNEELANLIEYYQMHYPNNKFITEEKTKDICQKYGLLCAETIYYISDVPEKNLTEIENFKLRQEDMNKFQCGWLDTSTGHYNLSQTKASRTQYGYLSGRSWNSFVFNNVSEDTKEVYEPSPLKICASVKDFDTKNMRIKDGYKLELNLPDPIVLQPVKGGYLVVSKWGLEADDAELINEKLN